MEPWEAEEITLEDLLEDGRYAEVEDLIDAAMEAGRVGPWALSLKAICQAALGRQTDALASAQEAVSRDPDSPMAHWCLGIILCDRNRLDEALQAARLASTLAPDDPRPHALMAQVCAVKGDWRSCRAHAQAGLGADPGDEPCANLRALALRHTDSGEDWGEALESLAATFPASSWVRAGQGWRALEAGQATDAQTHFEQALALDPTAEWAISGLTEALKARNPVYAGILRFFLWIDRLPTRTKWAYFLGGWFGYRFLRVQARANPEIAVVAYPLMALWVFFLLVSWISRPLSDFVLSRTEEGAALIRGERKVVAYLVAGVLGFAVVAGVLSAGTGWDRAGIAAFATGFLVIPLAAIPQCPTGWPRTTMIGFAALPTFTALGTLISPINAATGLAVASVALSVMGSWLATFLRTRLPKR